MISHIILFTLAGFLLSSSVLHASNQDKELRVQGNSMAPQIMDGTHVRLKPIPNPAEFHHGQLIALKFSRQSTPMLKRVFARPGDHLEIQAGQFVLNKQSVTPEGWAGNYQLSEQQSWLLSKQLQRSDYTIPNNTLVVLGDNPLNSLDSLDYGFVSFEQITGIIYK